MNFLVISQIYICCSSTRVDELHHLLKDWEGTKTDKKYCQKKQKRWQDMLLYFNPNRAGEWTDATCVINKLQSVRSRHCPASGLKYRGVIIIYYRAHYDNTNHTISSSDLEPDDLIHLAWFSITHKHTVSNLPHSPGINKGYSRYVEGLRGNTVWMFWETVIMYNPDSEFQDFTLCLTYLFS